jgi:hypothetical protein
MQPAKKPPRLSIRRGVISMLGVRAKPIWMRLIFFREITLPARQTRKKNILTRTEAAQFAFQLNS